MLQYSTVEPGTLDILKRLMDVPELQDFYLVGGTALSLLYGHRKSIDIDLFSQNDFSPDLLATTLAQQFTDFRYLNAPNAIGVFAFIGDVKVDLVNYSNFGLINAITTEDGIRMASVPDIAAMKIGAILKRGVKKDFWDISELLSHYTVENLIDFYNRKYDTHQLLISIPQALTYFDDAKDSETPVSLKGQTWAVIKKNIQSKVAAYLR